MKELSLNKLENLEGGKFWGSTNTQVELSGGGYFCHHTYTVLWTIVSQDTWISATPCEF